MLKIRKAKNKYTKLRSQEQNRNKKIYLKYFGKKKYKLSKTKRKN